MKCNQCGSEYNPASSYLKIAKCPFCGVSLTQLLDDNDATMDKVMKKIFEQFGPDIALDKKIFISVLKDYAPNLKKEVRIISIALDDNIAKYFINCRVEDRQNNIRKAKQSLNAIMSDSDIEMVISSFILALNWDTEDPYIDHSASDQIQRNIYNNSVQNTESSLVTQPMILPKGETKSIDPLQTLNMESSFDWLFNHIKTYPGLSETPENEFKYKTKKMIPLGGLGRYNQILRIDQNNYLETVRITEYIGKRDVVVIPNRVAFRRVTAIENSAFKNSKTVKKIFLPYSLVQIDSFAFNQCYYLEEVVIPDNVTTICEHAFFCCKNLKNVVIPNSVISIGISAFERCKSLDTIILPNSIKSIGDRAFAGCSKLKKIEIPNSVTHIGIEAFGYGIGKTLIVGNSSYAQKYAKENHMHFIIKS